MTQNVGPVDRIIRIVLAIAFAYGAVALSGAWVWVLGVLAAVALITGLTGFCPLYRLLGINTNRRSHERALAA